MDTSLGDSKIPLLAGAFLPYQTAHKLDCVFSGVRIPSFYWERILTALPMVAVWTILLSYLGAVSVNVVSRKQRFKGKKLLWLLKVGLKPLAWLVLWSIALAVVEWINKIPGYLAPSAPPSSLLRIVSGVVLGGGYLLFILFATLVPFYLLRERLPILNAVAKSFRVIYSQFWRVLAAILVVSVISSIPLLIYWVYLYLFSTPSGIARPWGWLQVWSMLANVLLNAASWCFGGALYLRFSTSPRSKRSHQVTCGS